MRSAPVGVGEEWGEGEVKPQDSLKVSTDLLGNTDEDMTLRVGI